MTTVLTRLFYRINRTYFRWIETQYVDGWIETQYVDGWIETQYVDGWIDG